MRSSPFGRADPRDETPHGWLTAQPYAHRGLHGPGIAENSRAACRAAAAARHGIELDVRLSRDGFAVVFHDADLARMTGETGRVAQRPAAELGRLRLAGTDDRIEPLPDILRLLAGRAPLLVELKTDDHPHVAARLCLSVRHALEGYRGRFAVMSFDPAVPAWFAEHAPHIARGLVVGRPHRDFVRNVRTRLSLRRARPHFLACDVRALPNRLASKARRAGPVLAWTVRTDADDAVARRYADQIIFEA